MMAGPNDPQVDKRTGNKVTGDTEEQVRNRLRFANFENFEVLQEGNSWVAYELSSPPLGTFESKDEALAHAAGLGLRPEAVDVFVDSNTGLFRIRGTPEFEPSGMYARQSIANQVMGNLGLEETHRISRDPKTGLWFLTEKDSENIAAADLKIVNTFKLGNGQILNVLNDGRTFTAQGKGGLDIVSIEMVNATGERFAVFSDGSKAALGIEAVDPKDVSIAKTIGLGDGTSVAILSSGQQVRVGQGRAPAEVFTDPITGRFAVRQPDGNLQFLEREFHPTIASAGGFNFLQQRSGQLQELGLPETPAHIEEIAGQSFIRGTRGELVPLDNALERAIEQAVIDGDFEKAVAFDDFRQRPSRLEFFNAALAFARSPADQQLVSALAHGDTIVEQVAPGEVRRIGPQPEFLQDAFAGLEGQVNAGRAPTQAEFSGALSAPTLEDRLKSEADRRKQELHELALQSAQLDLKSKQFTFEQQLAGTQVTSPTAVVTPSSTSSSTSSSTGGGTTATTTPAEPIEFTAEGLAAAGLGEFEIENVLGSLAPAAAQEPEPVDFGPSKKPRTGAGVFGLAHGGTVRNGTAVVGEEGPELIHHTPAGTQVTPLSEKAEAKIKKRGVPGMQEGGIVFNDTLPTGLRRLQRGQTIPASRGRLFRAAGLATPSSQSLRNLLPEEVDIFRDLGAQAGIPAGSFEREFQSGAAPGRHTGLARFLPLSLRR